MNIFQKIRLLRTWARQQFAAPSPHFIKQACLLRNGLENATWIETGTYMGATTRVLSSVAKKVYSLEPEPTLFANAQKALSDLPNVELIAGPSETVFPELLQNVRGDVCFWLDGHYSAGVTYQGAKDTPIIEELECIEKNLQKFGRVRVLVDDLRCFQPENPDFAAYPPVDFLVDWSRKNALSWHIEHDIFIAARN